MFTDADFEAVITQARARGRTLADGDAVVFLAAKDLLAEQPNHAAAQTVVTNFKRFMLTGERTESFAEFMINTEVVPPGVAASRLAKSEAYCRNTLAYFRGCRSAQEGTPAVLPSVPTHNVAAAPVGVPPTPAMEEA